MPPCFQETGSFTNGKIVNPASKHSLTRGRVSYCICRKALWPYRRGRDISLTVAHRLFCGSQIATFWIPPCAVAGTDPGPKKIAAAIRANPQNTALGISKFITSSMLVYVVNIISRGFKAATIHELHAVSQRNLVVKVRHIQATAEGLSGVSRRSYCSR